MITSFVILSCAITGMWCFRSKIPVALSLVRTSLAFANIKIRSYVKNKAIVYFGLPKVEQREGVLWIHFDFEDDEYFMLVPLKKGKSKITIDKVTNEDGHDITKQFQKIHGINQDFSGLELKPSDVGWDEVNILATNKRQKEVEYKFTRHDSIKF